MGSVLIRGIDTIWDLIPEVKAEPSAQQRETYPIRREEIELRAYFLSLENGGADPIGDWLRAEAELVTERGS